MFYKYKVGWYNSYKDKEEFNEGIVCSHGWSQATDRVIDSYGYDNVFELSLRELLAEDEDYCLPKEDIEYAFKED